MRQWRIKGMFCGLVFGLCLSSLPIRAQELTPTAVQDPTLIPTANSLALLNLYSPFDPHRLAALAEVIKKKLMIEVNLVQIDKENMAARLQKNPLQPSPDLLLMADSGRLERLARADLIRSFTPSKKDDQFLTPEAHLELKSAIQAIPPQWQMDKGQWVTVGKFARLVVVREGYPRSNRVIGYLDLSRPEFAEKICQNNQLYSITYQSLLAQILMRIEREATAKWLTEVKRNFAPLSLTEQASIDASLPEEERILRQLSQNLCDIALVSSRSLGILADRTGPEDQKYFKRFKVIWPQLPPMAVADKVSNPMTAGVAMEAIGLVLPINSSHTKEAAEIALFLLSDEGQKLLAEILHSYPVKPGVEIPKSLVWLGGFTQDTTPLDRLLPRYDEAAAIAETSGD
ncbi:MAG: hypothetical protein QM523_02235 [Candidatus Pacebacteria bacterium]|nr:hypothetical protein [Candidatus Paceibacterota bacterium]